MKRIAEAQVEEKQLKRLAAQRQLYFEGKRLQVLQVILAVPLSVLISVSALRFPEMQNLAAAWALVSIVVYVLSCWERKFRERAAKVQELFDCEVLQMKWNDVACNGLPDIDDVVSYSAKYLKREGDFSAFINPPWYISDTDRLPIFIGRILCQRENISWEARSRKRYAVFILSVFVALAVIILGIALHYNMGFQSIIMKLILPLFPAFFWSFTNYSENKETSNNMMRMKEQSYQILKKAHEPKASEEEITKASRALQDQIYQNRRDKPSVFNLLYKIFKDKDELHEREATETIVRDILEQFVTENKK